MKRLTVIQHTSADYLGLIEDHLEGRRIGFNYIRPFTERAQVPHADAVTDGLILLGGGPWGSAGQRNVPTLVEEVELTYACLQRQLPVIGIGLGAQILALAAGGSTLSAPYRLTVTQAERTTPDALNGYLPARFSCVEMMRDRPQPPSDATILARNDAGDPVVFQIGDNALGFTGHPGVKLAMVEDLIMEFEEGPDAAPSVLDQVRETKREIEDALVSIMTGVMQLTQWMSA
ncbi:MAG: type 1 glutamine amidotransferase [Gammaproteobacteria bacterium]